MFVNNKFCLKLKNQQGFTIIEAMIGIAILSIGILAAATMQYSTVKNNTTGNVVTQANMLAQAQMETLKNMDMSDIASGGENDIDENGNPGGIYNRSWVVTSYPDPADSDPSSLEVAVTVSWSRLGGDRSVVLESITRGDGI